MKPSSVVRLLALSCSPFMAMANSDYAATCNSASLNQPGYSINYPSYFVDFSANCREEDGEYSIDTGVNLSWCFANSDGVLVAQEDGRFGESCKDLSLSGTVMDAECKNEAGTYVSTSINLDDYVGNSNGGLVCYNSDGY